MMIALMKAPTKTRHRSRVWQDVALAGWAAVLGLVSGLACVGVRLGFRMLQVVLVRHAGLLPDAAAHLSNLHRFAVPVVGAILATLVLVAARHWSGGAPFEEYVGAVRCEHGAIPFASTLWRTLSSAFSVATGAAVGREGSMIQFATAVTSWFGSRSRLHTIALSRQVTFGAAAAVAAAYQAPLAAIFFGYEIVLGEWNWADLPGLAVASVAGWGVSRFLLGEGSLFPVHGPLSADGLIWTLPLCLVLGALAPAYQALLRSATILRKLPAPLLWSGALVGLLSLRHPAVWGNGDVALETMLSGGPLLLGALSLLLFRLLATTACVGTGTVGGVFTPTLFAGAALGLLGGRLAHVSHPGLLILVGLSVFLAAVTHAPFMAGLMAVELTGQWHVLPFVLLLNVAAVQVAKRISSQSLYEIASPDPEPSMIATNPKTGRTVQENPHEYFVSA